MPSKPSQEEFHQLALQLAGRDFPAGWESVASSVNARVAYSPVIDVYYKEFLPRGPLEFLKATVRGSRASRARKESGALQEKGFNAPANLAWGKLPGRREYLFTRAAPGHGVTHWLRETLVDRHGEALHLRRTLLHDLGGFIGKVHAAGFIHGDLRTSNVLASLSDDNGFSFTLIDNERNRRSTPPPGKGLLRNLMQLNMLTPSDLSLRDRMRFFVSWRRQMTELSDVESKLIAAEAYHWAMSRLYAKGKL